MKKQLKLRGALRYYLQWPIILTALLAVMAVVICWVDRTAGLVALIFVLVYGITAFVLFFLRQSRIVGDLVLFAADYGQVQRRLLRELAIPYAVIDSEGRFLWMNDSFSDVSGISHPSRHLITELFPELDKEQLPKDEQDVEYRVVFQEHHYRVLLRRVFASEFDEDIYWSHEGERPGEDKNTLIAVYLYDETEITTLKQENNDQKLIIGLLYIDNYDEALDSIDEVRRSLLIALVDRKINKYMQSLDAIIKKLEKDKYIFVFQKKYLDALLESRFPLLDEVRTVNIGNDMSITISMGLSVEAETFTRGYEMARVAIDLALGRGGDQVVVKEKDKIYYYGGKSVSVERNTRVKARVKAHALKEFVESKDKVVIMGHSLGDIDSLGASIGVYRIAKTLNKPAHIVINELTASVRPMLQRFIQNPDYEEDMFLNIAQAREMVDANTLLVIVDVNRPSYTECPELLSQTKTTVILDHHRQTGEEVESAVLSYIEPYASSACEMVAEILQYVGDNLKLRQTEADAMYAGIMIDTNNFLTKTGVRTFEAAAFLRRCGADVTRIRKMFRTDLAEYIAKASAVTSTEVYKEHYAFAELTSDGLDSPTVLGAQVANELLNIVDIKATFVLTSYNEKVYISARSIDELNVQVLMEKLGGGGHMSVAGAQLTDCTVEEAMDRVKEGLDEMLQSYAV